MYWIILFLQLWCLVPCWSRLDEDIIPKSIDCLRHKEKTCFYQPVEKCPKPESKCRCHQLPDCRKAAVCCNITSDYQLTEGLACANITNNGYIKALHIRNATLDVFNISQHTWRMLKYMSVTDGHINKVVGEFGKHAKVSCLNMSSNDIKSFEDRSLVNLYNLTLLDLSNNNLSTVPSFRKEGNLTLDISNNNLSCSNVFDAMNRTEMKFIKKAELKFMNYNNTFCVQNKDFEWFNAPIVVHISNLISLLELQKHCIKNCTCQPRRTDILPGKTAIVSVMVNCSGQHFWSLPEGLPKNTIALNISNNNISSLELLNSDESYENLRELYADNNQITSILPLEGSKFVNSFLALSLKNNRLESLPTYFLSNMFDRNPIHRSVFLGRNKLHCDCNTAKVLKVWLLSKQKNIPDYDEIYCDNLNMKVVELDSTKLCQSQQDWTDYIYYIITAEVLLLVLLVAKVSYDYWVFKTAGYLPWPASKMPKLPCDWLCE